MARQVIHLEQFSLGLVKSGPGYLIPGEALTRAENVQLDQTATLRRTYGHVNDGVSAVGASSRTAGLHLHNEEGTLRKLSWYTTSGLQLYENYADVTASQFWPSLGAGDPWVSVAELQRRSVHAIAADAVKADTVLKYNGTDIRNVGIVPPDLTSTTATPVEPKTEQIDSMGAGWTFNADAGSGHLPTGGHDSGGSALLVYLSGTNTANITKNFGLGAIPEEFTSGATAISQDDYVVVWVDLTEAGVRRHPTRLIDTITIDFSMVSGNFTTDLLTTTVSGSALDRVWARDAGNSLTEVGGGGVRWWPFFVKRSAFARSGSNPSLLPLSSARAIRLTATVLPHTGVSLGVTFSDLEFWGGFELDGAGVWDTLRAVDLGALDPDESELVSGGIELAITFENEDGFESSGTEFAITPVDPIRGQIDFAALPAGAANDGVTKIHFYTRIIGTDVTFKRADTLTLPATTFSLNASNVGGASMPTTHDKPPGARFAVEYQDHLFLGATSASEREYVFSKQGIDWEAFPNVPERLDDDLMGFASMPGGLAILTRSSLWFLTGNDINDFVQVKVEGARGCVAPRSIAVTPLGAVYLAFDGLYLFDGARVTRLSSRVRGVFDGTADVVLNQARVEYSVGTWDGRRLRYVLAYPSGSAQLPDRALVFWAEHGWAATEETWDADAIAYDAHAGDLYLSHPESGNAIRTSTVGVQADDFDGADVTWDVETAEVGSQPPVRHRQKTYDAVWTEHAPATATIEVAARVDEQDPYPDSVSTGDFQRSGDPRSLYRHQINRAGLRASVRARGDGELDSLRFIWELQDEAG